MNALVFVMIIDVDRDRLYQLSEFINSRNINVQRK